MTSNVHRKLDVDSLQDHEYDAQLFGFTEEQFMIAIKLLVKEEVTVYTELMTNALLKKYSPNDPETEQVKEITKSLIDQYICASVEHLKDLEDQLKTLLHFPPHVLLTEDTVQRTQFSAEDEQDIDEQLKQLLNRLKRTKSFTNELCQELKVLRDALPLLNKRVKEFEQLVTESQESDKVFQNMEPSIDEMFNERLKLLNINKDL